MKNSVTPPFSNPAYSRPPFRKLMVLFLCLLWMLATGLPALAQQVVKGRVTNENGQGVPNASVTVKGTTNGVSSNAAGAYQISAPANATLVISSVGFSPKEVSVNGQATINVSLGASGNDLDQVVVIGYGTQKRKDVTGSIVSVGEKALDEVPAVNISTALQGRAAGVDIARTGTRPGAAGQIRIRGNRSLSATNDPLIVVDGMPYGGSINDLNVDDIANIDILKDASATAIYGSRGSNGVIIVTTKRGRVGKPVISFNTSYGLSNPISKFRVFNGEEYTAFKQESRYGAGSATGTAAFTDDEKAGITNGTSTDWQDLIYQTGHLATNDLSLSGGTDVTQYGMGISYLDQTGILPGIGFQRFSLRASLDQKIGSRIRVGLNTMNTLSYTDGEGINPMYNLLALSPLVSPYKADGTMNLLPMGGGNPHQDVGVRLNPLTLLDRNAIKDQRRRLRTYNTLYGELQILKSLRYRVNVALDFRDDNYGTYRGANTILSIASSTPFQSNTASTQNGESWTYAIDHQLLFDQVIAEKHKISFIGLFGMQQDQNFVSTFNAVGIPADYIQNYNFNQATTITQPAGADMNGFIRSGLVSYMTRVNYNYNGRYNLTATFRRDGSSRLAPGNKWFNYPAVAASWNVSDEAFMQGAALVSNLKLRAGWGITSNQSVNPYATLGGLASNNYNFGGTNVIGYYVASLPNKRLKWESTAVSNAGLDFGFFNSRITGSIDVYQSKTKDLLVAKALPISNGAASVITNAAKTESKGIEIALSTVNIENLNGWRWSTDINWSVNREKITALEEPGKLRDVGNGWFVGQPLNVIYDFKKIGIWQAKDAALVATYGAPQAVGRIRVADMNNDNRITADDQTIIGSAQPEWVGGMTNRITYKNVDLSVVAFARWGGTLIATYFQSNNGGTGGYAFFHQGRVNEMKVNYWTPTNPGNDFPHPEGFVNNDNYTSTLGYYDATFVKIRSINLGYTIPTAALARLHINTARIYVSATNPFIVYSPFVRGGYGIDPEGTGTGTTLGPTGGGSSTPTSGRAILVSLNTPTTRELIVGLNLKF